MACPPRRARASAIRLRPTPTARSITDYPQVLKADGLPPGRGSSSRKTPIEAAQTIHRIMDLRIFGEAGREMVIEEFLPGREMSVHVLTDGISHVILPIAQDHKRLGEGDTGPNTGGMGAYAPAPFATEELQAQISRADRRAGAGGIAQGGDRFSRHSLHRPHLDEGRAAAFSNSTCAAAIPKRRCCCRSSTRRWSRFSRRCGNSAWADSPSG